jgi:hypothetical protein
MMVSRHLSEETKRKISLSNMGKKLSDETKEKLRLSAIGRRHSDESKQKMSLSRRGINNSRWKGGRKLRGGGYWLILRPNHRFANSQGYVREHRIIVEDQWNCCLLPWADVHHRDGDKQNNVWYNLWPMMRGQHTMLSEPEKRLPYRPIPNDRRCFICNRNMTQIKNNSSRDWHMLDGQYACDRCHARETYRRQISTNSWRHTDETMLRIQLAIQSRRYAKTNFMSGKFHIPEHEWMKGLETI